MSTHAEAPGAAGVPGGAGAAGAAARRELAGFLRSRRERIAPEQVGLPVGRRRRTPGLRREEVAQLATVGVTWYTWLEQARDIRVSAQVADSIARALMLDRAERAHFFQLAGVHDPDPRAESAAVTPALQAIVDQLAPLPAAVSNGRYDLIAYNRTYARLIDDLDALPPRDRNFLWLVFTHPAWREAIVDREAATRVMVAKFRIAMADHLAEPAWKHLLGRLREASPEFAEVWDRHEVQLPENLVKRFLNPHVGLLAFDSTILWLGPRQGPRLITYTPLDDVTRERLEKLHALSLEGSQAAPA